MRYLLHDVFTQSVKMHPDKVAIKEETGKRYSYRELNTVSNQFAHFFLSLKDDIKKQPFVGILSPIHGASIAAVLGTLKSGGAYVPLDEHSPSKRLKRILENTKLDVLVVDAYWIEKHRSLLKEHALRKVILLPSPYQQGLSSTDHQNKLVPMKEVEKFPCTDPLVINQVSDDLAYILHSSGSTGVPKGIMLTHRNARTFVDWMHKEFNVSNQDTLISRAPFKFDLSVFDIFNTFKAGATLVCFDWLKKRENKHAHYVKLMETHGVSILYTTPSTFMAFMNEGRLKEANLRLRTIMYAGEAFTVPQLSKLQAILPNTKIANIYGPTETNIITCQWVDRALLQKGSPIPLGREVDDTEIIIVSENGSMCEPNEVGELWCRGGTVTLGYLGMEEKTKECSVKSPFHPYPVRFWRTGDYGFRDENGVLHYRGRRDHMVKVKGYRIELGEIEAAVAQYPGISQFCVVASKNAKYGSTLHCFYSTLSQDPIPVDIWTKFLQGYLPKYMLPSTFIYLEYFPNTSSGKIDRMFLSQSLEEGCDHDC